MALTSQQQELVNEVNNWRANVAPKGLNLNEDTSDGHVNTQILIRFLNTNKIPYTSGGLSQAVQLEARRLIWAPGTEPWFAEESKASAIALKRKSDGIDSVHGAGGSQGRYSETERIADEKEKFLANEARQAAVLADRKKQSDARQQQAEETQLVFYETGQINHGASLALQNEAKARRGVAPPAVLRGFTGREEFTRKELYALTSDELGRLAKAQQQVKREEAIKNSRF
jgi:hypothetical protein